MSFSNNRSGIAIVLLLLGGFAAHISAQPTSLTDDDKKSPEAFLSGGARSEKVLVEMLTTLRQIDARLAAIEEIAKKSGETRTANEDQSK